MKPLKIGDKVRVKNSVQNRQRLLNYPWLPNLINKIGVVSKIRLFDSDEPLYRIRMDDKFKFKSPEHEIMTTRVYNCVLRDEVALLR